LQVAQTHHSCERVGARPSPRLPRNKSAGHEGQQRGSAEGDRKRDRIAGDRRGRRGIRGRVDTDDLADDAAESKVDASGSLGREPLGARGRAGASRTTGGRVGAEDEARRRKDRELEQHRRQGVADDGAAVQRCQVPQA
jgi:hypothetical protein